MRANDDGTTSLRIQAAYLAKVIGVVLALISLAAAPAFLRTADLDQPIKNMLLALLVLAVLLLPLLARMLYRRMDELQQRLHERACMFALGVLMPAAFLAGILQVYQRLPQFSLFWICAVLVGSWGLGLALADRKFN
jgi:hypothetical protein